ncbi:Y-family DNA polymerase [Candidatus Woesebacteria bacterium]|nr:Y-family DNA polymerase [Candidatus Woesebacteria bacterium]
MYSVIDCNNFFVSCERVFRPDLAHHPVVVLSNNDGCVVSRSAEAKLLGIPMGAPAFKYADIFNRHRVTLFSSNFSLYADMSHRVMNTIQSFAPQMEIYSIDEAFIPFEGYSESRLVAHLESLRKTILQSIGIPVSIGIAPTKTLAKLANETAKIDKTGVAIMYPEDLNSRTCDISVSEIWGIGRALTQFLAEHGIFTVPQLVACDDAWIKKHLTISGLKTVRELRGISCIPFEEIYPAKQSIISSKSFGRPVKTQSQMKEAVAAFTTRAAEKLRAEHEVATHIGVSMTTNFHKKDERQYSNSATTALLQPTNVTPDLIKEALGIVDRIFKPGFSYKKAVVSLIGLHDEKSIQQGMFGPDMTMQREVDAEKKKRLMATLDRVNGELGRGTLSFLAEGVTKKWKQKRERASPRYTTRWDELAVVKSN